MSCRRSYTTHTTQPSTDESQTHPHHQEREEEHIRRASRPPSSPLSIERSERFPDCLLEIPLATPWPKQTLRLANRTYSLTTTIFLLPVGSSLSIILVCVLSLAQPSNQPHPPNLTRTAAHHPVAPVTERYTPSSAPLNFSYRS